MFSICMATYNGSKFITRQVDSILRQLSGNDQIVIVDDCSQDNTVELIKRNYGNRVEIILNETNMGPIKSFEKAILAAKGDFIFLCDQDDIWEENKVEMVKTAFLREKADLVVHDAYVVDGNMKLISSSWNKLNRNNLGQGLFGNIKRNAFTGAMMAFRRDLVPKILPFPKSIEMHDQWIAIVCMLEKRKIVYIDHPLMKYVRHGGNVTGMKKRSIMKQIKGRLGTTLAAASYKK